MFSDEKSLRKCLLHKKYVQHFKVKIVFFFTIWEGYFEKVGIHWFMIEQIQFDICYKKTKDRIWGLNTKLFIFLCVWNTLPNLSRSQMESVHFVSSKEHFWLKMWNWFSSNWEWKKKKRKNNEKNDDTSTLRTFLREKSPFWKEISQTVQIVRIKLSKCCIFWPAFGCCASQMLVEIVIFSIFCAKKLKKRKK